MPGVNANEQPGPGASAYNYVEVLADGVLTSSHDFHHPTFQYRPTAH